jgi:hypothetical protein
MSGPRGPTDGGFDQDGPDKGPDMDGHWTDIPISLSINTCVCVCVCVCVSVCVRERERERERE